MGSAAEQAGSEISSMAYDGGLVERGKIYHPKFACGGQVAKGGMVPHYDSGGQIPQQPSFFTSFVRNAGNNLSGNTSKQDNNSEFSNLAGTNGQQDQMQEGGNQVGLAIGNGLSNLFSSSSLGAYKGGQINMKQGGGVPGKAKVKGDSIKNDTIPAMVSPGEIVIPRSIVNDSDAPKKAAEFVAAILAKKGSRK
jgi:hypothetical protein